MILALACASHRGITDEGLAANVRSAVAEAFSGSPPAMVDISVRNGVVTLSGQVRSEDDRRKVVRAVNSVNGVRTVINQMTIAP